MKEKFSIMKRKLLKQEGVTLLELLITISLVGLIFGLGIYPMLSQIRLFRAERAETALFDDANLAVNYITRDAMRSEKADDTTANEITFTINAASLLGSGVADPTLRILHNVRYYTDGTELRREYQGAYTVITNKLTPGTPQTFKIDPYVIGNQLHHFLCNIQFEDGDIETERVFEVMLRCKDAKLVKP